MSVLLRKFASYLKSNPDGSSFQVVLQPDSDEDVSYGSVEPPVVSQAEIVEGSGMQAQPVGQTSGTRFTHFLDGAQTTRRVCYYQHSVPIVYGFIGAVIRKRDIDRCMSTYDKEFQEKLYQPSCHLDTSGLKTAGLELRDVKIRSGEKSDSNDIHPLRLLELARQTISNDRAELERELAERWVESSSPEDWLFWDGSITGSVEASKHPRVVGVIKSHQTQYFGVEEQRKILSLKVGERSSVFQPRGKDWTPVYSWYLRLHSNEGRDLYFGLIRIEAMAGPETLKMADEISRWLLAERSPLALPDGRWDKMIYPIRDCEQYLRSIMPTKVAIEAALAGV